MPEILPNLQQKSPSTAQISELKTKRTLRLRRMKNRGHEDRKIWRRLPLSIETPHARCSGFRLCNRKRKVFRNRFREHSGRLDQAEQGDRHAEHLRQHTDAKKEDHTRGIHHSMRNLHRITASQHHICNIPQLPVRHKNLTPPPIPAADSSDSLIRPSIGCSETETGHRRLDERIFGMDGNRPPDNGGNEARHTSKNNPATC